MAEFFVGGHNGEGRPTNPSQMGRRITQRGENRSVFVTITNRRVLDCCICYEILSIPVFECGINGHLYCSSCCSKLGSKCPMCPMPIGLRRCRAIEKLLNSIKILCINANYGCSERISYCNQNEHQDQCIYAPCICPHSHCSFRDSSKELSKHFSDKHKAFMLFTLNRSFPVSLDVKQKVFVLQEINYGILFILNNSSVEHLGSSVSVTCIGPKSSKAAYYYCLNASNAGGSSLKFQSSTKNSQGPYANAASSAEFLLIPSGFLDSPGQIMTLRIMIGKSKLSKKIESTAMASCSNLATC